MEFGWQRIAPSTSEQMLAAQERVRDALARVQQRERAVEEFGYLRLETLHEAVCYAPLLDDGIPVNGDVIAIGRAFS